jgi:hypothetical protein
MNLAACLLALSLAAEPAKNPFLFNDGDRVVFLGGTLIEREQRYGYWELALTLLNKDKNVTFRNLGWSGDTVWCESRGSFDGPKKGFENTVALVKELKPTVIVMCYGQVESFDGEAGVQKFTEGYEKLIDALAVTKARIVLMTPAKFEDVEPLKDADARNKSLSLYVEATRSLASKKSAGFFDLNSASNSKGSSARRTENGIHLGREGYADLQEAFGWKTNADANELREAIVAKNRLYFDRWRPQNQTYLFGFRKHEQGRNAKEIAEFDPLIEKAEKDIAELRKKIK